MPQKNSTRFGEVAIRRSALIASAIAILAIAAAFLLPSIPQISATVEQRRGVIDACLKLLGERESLTLPLSAEEHKAVWTLGALRASEGSEMLVRLISAPSNNTRLEPIVGSDMQGQSLLSEYPCANALVLIGMPGVDAIVQRLNEKKTISNTQTILFAEVIRSVLGSSHAKSFVEIEAKQAKEDSRTNFDKVLQEERLVSLGILVMPGTAPSQP